MPRNSNPKRVQKARIKARLAEIGSSQRKLAVALGIHPPGVSALLNGNRKLKATEAVLAAEHLRWPLSEINALFGISDQQKGYGKLPIWGYIDATSGQIVIRADVDSGSLEEIDAPFPGYMGKCVRIKGNSMAPRYRDGEVVAFTENAHDLTHFLHQEVIIATTDGRRLLKILHPGQEPNRYTLVSLSPEEEPILNVELAWVAPIDWHLPRRV